MTANVNILRGDLHLAVSTAFNRGRYVLMTGGDGHPQEITIDLRERPDDLFTAEDAAVRTRRERAGFVPSGDPASVYDWNPTDDHGPSVPAQGEYRKDGIGYPEVYEFALQDAEIPDLLLENALLADAPDQAAANAADWVHVYDRVTRESRTLKRPEPDRILTGLRDVAADLRGERGSEVFTPARGAPVEPPFGCAALPPVGPLTSTEGLRAGDVLRVLPGHIGAGEIKAVRKLDEDSFIWEKDDAVRSYHFGCYAFVGRPDADGWMTWAGGENPVPGAWVELRFWNGHVTAPELSDAPGGVRWTHNGSSGDIVAFRIVDTPPAV